jgi:hypothetical protein
VRCSRQRAAIFILSLAILALTGCSSVGCGTLQSYEPFVQLIYPEPNAANVDQNVGILVYSSTKSVPITLSAGSAAPIALAPSDVPSPLPSPAASPTSTGSVDMAVLLPALTAGTTYTVSAGERLVGCGANQATTFRIGSFTTK